MSRSFRGGQILGIALFMALLLADTWLVVRNTRRLGEDAGLVSHTHEVLGSLSEIQSTLDEAESGQRGYVITGEDSYLEPYYDALARIESEKARLAELVSDNPVQTARLPVLRTRLDARLTSLQHNLELRRDGSFEAARNSISTHAGEAQMTALRAHIDTMEADEQKLLARREVKRATTYRVALFGGIIAGLSSLALLVALVALLRRDLRTRAEAADEVASQRELLQTTLSSIGDAVIATDAEARVSFVNRVAAELTGWDGGEMIGRPLDEVFVIVDEDHRRPAVNPAKRALADGRVVGLANHTILVAKDGAERAIDDSAAPIRDATGKLVGAVLVFRDVTKQRLVDRELRESEARKDEFLATLSHELRNPLAPIRNAVEVMKLAEADRESVAWARGMIERQVQQLARLVDDLLDISRISRGKLELRRERADLCAVVTAAIESSRVLIDEKQQALTVQIPAERIDLFADATRLLQVVQNLLNNAARYTPQGGRIWITVAREGGEAIVRVRDSGMGIPAEMLPRVFDMFVQGEQGIERGSGGLGLGLTLVRTLVEMHDGRVEAHSAGAELGSEFVVHLPLPAGAGVIGAGTPSAAPPASPRTKRRVLVVDDNADSVTSLDLMLRILGHEVATAHDGVEAVEQAGTFEPDLILLDIGLPRLNGYEAARQIRALPRGGRVVLVAVTGWGQEEDRRRSRAAGFDHHIVKPVEPAALERILAGLADRAG